MGWAAMQAPNEMTESRARGRSSRKCSTSMPEDYPQGPHDKPQSMCPAFGSLRVGLRMRRVATVSERVRLLRLSA